MRLETLALKGVGPFTDEVRLDLRALPPGLIAITGENGAGKTMLLEAAIGILDREFISREKAIVDFCGDDRGAFVEATYLFEGRGAYRARLNMDGLKGGSEAVLQLVGAPKPLNDGKVSTFDVARAQIFPPREVLLASAFAAQNRRGSFATVGKGGRKDLFALILGLERYARWAETARRAAALLDVRRAELRTLIERLDAESNDAVTEQLGVEANQLQAAVGTAEVRAEHLTREIAALEGQLQAARSQASAYASAVSALAAVQERRRDLEAERDREGRELAVLDEVFARSSDGVIAQRDRRIAAAEKAIADLPAIAALEQRRDRELAAVDTQLALDRKDKDERIRNNRALVADADTINLTARRIEEAWASRNALVIRGRDLHAAIDTADREVRLRRREQDACASARTSLASAESAAQLLEAVPCGGTGDFAACQFIVNARAAQDRLDALRADVEKLSEAERMVQAAETAAAAAREAEAALDREMAAIQDGIVALQREGLGTSKLTSFEARLAALGQAQQRLMELEQDLAALAAAADTRRAGIRRDHDERVDDRARAHATQTEERAAAVREAQAEITSLEERYEADRATAIVRRDGAICALAQLETELQSAEEAVAAARVDEDLVSDLETRLTLARTDLGQTQTELARLDEKSKDLDRRRTLVMRKREEVATLRATLAIVEQDAVEWDSLARIFGKDGLPVLEIDAAGPMVSTITNDLLQACFGARFTVELVTQQAKASGKGLKEVFELLVWDAERPGDRARDITDLSGGEQVIVNEALMSAIAIYLNQRNEQPIRTCFRDETTGALDVENAPRYMQMLRRVLERGNFHQILFISHNADAAAMADVEVHVANGTLRVDCALGVAA